MPRNLVRDLMPLSQLGAHVVRGEASLTEVVRVLLEGRSAYEVYVVDAQDRLLGVLSAKRVVHHLFATPTPRASSATDLLEVLSAERAEHLALREATCVRADEPAGDAVRRMLEQDLIEVPVVDAERRLVGSLDLLQVLAAWSEGRL